MKDPFSSIDPALMQKFSRKLTKAIHDFSMFSRSDKIAVALSGGKDSVLLLWILKNLNYNVEAFHLNLGIKTFTPKSLAYVEYVCSELKVKLHIIKAQDFAGFTVDDTITNYPHQQCAICGTLKRQMFNRFAIDNGFDVLAVGHNMDDEVEMLLGNNLRWDFGYLKKSLPVLKSRPGFVKRVKPLCYIREPDIRKFVRENHIDVLHCQCPHSRYGSRKKYAKILDFGETLYPNFIENYYKSFLKSAPSLNVIPNEELNLHHCPTCGELTSATLCRLCSVKAGLWRK